MRVFWCNIWCICDTIIARTRRCDMRERRLEAQRWAHKFTPCMMFDARIMLRVEGHNCVAYRIILTRAWSFRFGDRVGMDASIALSIAHSRALAAARPTDLHNLAIYTKIKLFVIRCDFTTLITYAHISHHVQGRKVVIFISNGVRARIRNHTLAIMWRTIDAAWPRSYMPFVRQGPAHLNQSPMIRWAIYQHHKSVPSERENARSHSAIMLLRIIIIIIIIMPTGCVALKERSPSREPHGAP